MMTHPVVDALRAAIGRAAVLVDGDIDERFLLDVLGNRGEAPLAVVRPASTDEVSKTLAICNDLGVAVVPQGGRTGLVRATLPQRGEVVLAMERMNRIEHIDVDAGTAIVQAGVVLQALHDALEPHGLAFPLDLGGRGSCTIGGNISTNAGGNRVIRYGMARDQVLGLEAVLADGTVLDGLKPFIKNNTGIDLKHLFIGSEGVLGVVTRLALRLIPRPAAASVAFCGLSDFAAVRALLRHLRARLSGDLTAFEVLWKDYYTRYLTLHQGAVPMPDAHEFYVLVESSTGDDEASQARFEQALHDAIDEGIVADAVVAKSGVESNTLWTMRDMALEVGMTLGSHCGFDVSLRIADMDAFANELADAARKLHPDSRVLVYGHAGDGNLHVAFSRPPDMQQTFEDINAVVYGLVARLGGSTSAEHGIGMSRRAWLGHTRTPAEIEAMRAIKRTLDPRNTLNPDRIFARRD
ncbi:MAG: FAD-binding oxidoreductase [Burkholderiaceae bacterium]|nr:FAD-binding oxidoreductase [Burkholderiaceae bacterium]